MSRGSIKKLDWSILDVCLDAVLAELSVGEIWVEDLVCRIIDRYVMLSGHKVILHNHYPKRRFNSCVSKKRLLSRGWVSKRRTRYSFIVIDGKKCRTGTQKRKAFRRGEEK